MTDVVEKLRELLSDGRRDEARKLLREIEGRLPDPAELGAEPIGGVPADREPDEQVMTAWALPAGLGGGAVFYDRSGPPRRLSLVDPDDTLILSFGGIGAAVGSVPIDLHRRSPGGETGPVAAIVVDVGPGSYGDADGPSPEEIHEELGLLLDRVAEAAGSEWIRFRELDKEDWDRAGFLRAYNALAEEHGEPTLDGETVDRENFWIRYGSTPAYLSVEAYARAVFRARTGGEGGSR